MERLVAFLVLMLVLAVCGVGVVVVRADDAAQAQRREQICLARVQASADLAQLAPGARVDVAGRIDLMEKLGAQLDRC